VAYAENFWGEGQVSPQSCDVTDQLYGKCRWDDYSRGPGTCLWENFAKLHLKIRIFVHSGSKF